MNALPNQLERLRQKLLTEKSNDAAWNIIDEYFSFMGMDTIKQELWILTKGTLTNDLMEQNEKGLDRHNIIFGYEFLLLFLDAVKTLHEARPKEVRKAAAARQIHIKTNSESVRQSPMALPAK